MLTWKFGALFAVVEVLAVVSALPTPEQESVVWFECKGQVEYRQAASKEGLASVPFQVVPKGTICDLPDGQPCHHNPLKLAGQMDTVATQMVSLASQSECISAFETMSGTFAQDTTSVGPTAIAGDAAAATEATVDLAVNTTAAATTSTTAGITTATGTAAVTGAMTEPATTLTDGIVTTGTDAVSMNTAVVTENTATTGTATTEIDTTTTGGSVVATKTDTTATSSSTTMSQVSETTTSYTSTYTR